MHPPHSTLRKMGLVGEIDIHSDILSIAPSALSTRRALKVGRVLQKQMSDKKGGYQKCIVCDPDENRPQNTSRNEVIIPGRVSGFRNDYPYLPEDQLVLYMWHDDLRVRQGAFHRYRLRDFGELELYWLVEAAIERGRRFNTPAFTGDIWRMVVGFNLGTLAGQSLPHFHLQYGWEVALEPRVIKKEALALYFKELEDEQLIIYSDERVRLVAPWTPKGQYATELYFVNKCEFRQLDRTDIQYFAVFGAEIIRRYMAIGIQNLNIVFTNSPVERETEPLVAHFVPRVNMAALYEIRGVNVVDTPPRNIAVEFTKVNSHREDNRSLWPNVARNAQRFDPNKLYEDRVGGGDTGPRLSVRSAPGANQEGPVTAAPTTASPTRKSRSPSV